ncbi:hypothetical protein LINPERPRIM_LOCUS6080, partial [Linum perenne]
PLPIYPQPLPLNFSIRRKDLQTPTPTTLPSLMALFVASGNGGAGTRTLSAATTNSTASIHRHQYASHFPRLPLPLSPRRGHLHIVSARNRRNSTKTTEKRDNIGEAAEDGGIGGFESSAGLNGSSSSSSIGGDDGFVMPKLPGQEKDFWEGPQWNTLGFVVEYLWGFGIIFSLIACGVAVSTYNEGATDFKDTPAYKESTQTGQVLEEPDESNSDVFESNPTEVAPSLE